MTVRQVTAAKRLAPAAVLVTAVSVGVVVAALAASRLPVPVVLPAARLLMDAGAVAAVGIVVLRWLVAGASRRDAEAVRAASTRAAVVVAGGWAALALTVLWLQAAELSGQPPGAIGVRTLTEYVDGAGRALLVTVGCAIGFGVTAACRWPDGLLAVLAVLGLVAPPVTGHAAAAALHVIAVLSVAAHAVAAAAWVGGLAALLAAAGARRALLAATLPRYSRLAGWSVGALAASGLLNATVRLGSASDLIWTAYGRILIAKTVLLLVLAAIGAQVRNRVLPAVAAHRATPLSGYAATELVLMAAALGLAAALTRAVA